MDSSSYRDLSLRLGYSEHSGNGINGARRMVERYGFDVSHFTGQCWNKNVFDYSKFEKGVKLSSKRVQKVLIYLRGRSCEHCGLSEWRGNLIPLEVHHIDGDSFNNELENLSLLCRNCHGVTDNFKGRLNTGVRKVSDDELINALEKNSSVHRALIALNMSPKGGNYKRAYDLINKYDISVGINGT